MGLTATEVISPHYNLQKYILRFQNHLKITLVRTLFKERKRGKKEKA